MFERVDARIRVALPDLSDATYLGIRVEWMIWDLDKKGADIEWNWANWAFALLP